MTLKFYRYSVLLLITFDGKGLFLITQQPTMEQYLRYLDKRDKHGGVTVIAGPMIRYSKRFRPPRIVHQLYLAIKRRLQKEQSFDAGHRPYTIKSVTR